MTAFGTWICRPRFPARITTSAVMTFVMLPIGLSAPRSRLHTRPPVAAFASTPPLAFSPVGAPVTCTPRGAGRSACLAEGAPAGFARAAGVARVGGAADRPAAARTLTRAGDFDGADSAADPATAAPARMLPPATRTVARTATRMTLPSASSASAPTREYRDGLSAGHRQQRRNTEAG